MIIITNYASTRVTASLAVGENDLLLSIPTTKPKQKDGDKMAKTWPKREKRANSKKTSRKLGQEKFDADADVLYYRNQDK